MRARVRVRRDVPGRQPGTRDATICSRSGSPRQGNFRHRTHAAKSGAFERPLRSGARAAPLHPAAGMPVLRNPLPASLRVPLSAMAKPTGRLARDWTYSSSVMSVRKRNCRPPETRRPASIRHACRAGPNATRSNPGSGRRIPAHRAAVFAGAMAISATPSGGNGGGNRGVRPDHRRRGAKFHEGSHPISRMVATQFHSR